MRLKIMTIVNTGNDKNSCGVKIRFAKKNGKRNRVFCLHTCNLKCVNKIKKVTIPRALYSCDINV